MSTPLETAPPPGRKTSLKALAAIPLSLALIWTVSPTVAGAEPALDEDSLRAAVVDAMVDREGASASKLQAQGREFQVNVSRQDDATGWAFGTAVITAPHVEDAYPDGWIFLARWADGQWQSGLDGTPAFLDLSKQAPAEIMSADEQRIFESQLSEEPVESSKAGIQATTSYTTELRLPYATGQSWRMTGGPHSSPRNSIDLAGGDGKVQAAGAGKVYVMCASRKGWLRVYHPNGYSSDYYHLQGNITPSNGTSVADGAFLGNIGTDVSCGGSATGPHVHWSILKGDSRTPWHLRSAGKWVFYDGASEYQGYAMHGSTRVNVGGSLYNYGALKQNQGIIDTFGGGTLNMRTGPGTNYPVAGSVSDGATVTMSCYRTGGTSHTGRWGTTNAWDKLSNGYWVSDAFVYSGMVYVGPTC